MNCDLVAGESVQHRVQRRCVPVDSAHFAGLRVGHRGRRLASGRLHSSVAPGAVETAVGRGLEQVTAPADEGVLLGADGAGLAAWLEHPVQRQADDHRHQQQDTDELHSNQSRALQGLVVVVRAAIGRQFDLGAEFRSGCIAVGEVVPHPSQQADNEDDPANCGGRQSDHLWPPPPPMQCGPSAS